MKMDGYDDCVIGVVELFGCKRIICYDHGKVIDRLVAEGMTIMEAEEYFEYNMLGSYVGEYTPCFLYRCGMDEINDMGDFCA